MEEVYVIEFDRYEKGTTINALNHVMKWNQII